MKEISHVVIGFCVKCICDFVGFPFLAVEKIKSSLIKQSNIHEITHSINIKPLISKTYYNAPEDTKYFVRYHVEYMILSLKSYA